MTQPNEWAGYARVSTEDQAEKYSLPTQIEAMKKKVAELGGQIPEQWIFVDHCTGTNRNRPAFAKLQELVDKQLPKGVVVYTVDRLSRDVEDGAYIYKSFKARGVDLQFVDFTLDDSPVGELMFNLLAAFARFEKRNFKDRSDRGRKKRIASGLLPSGAVPFGYRYDHGHMVIYEPEAVVVRQIFEWYAGGMSLYGIKIRLNREGIKSARGGLWSRTTVHQLLRNRAYVGEYITRG